MSTDSSESSASRVAVREARIHLAEILNRVAYRGERIVLHRRGKDAAALVPVEDLQLLEDLKDRIDAHEAKRVLAEMEARHEEPIPYEQVRRERREAARGPSARRAAAPDVRILALGENPRPPGSRKLRGTDDLYCVRAGD